MARSHAHTGRYVSEVKPERKMMNDTINDAVEQLAKRAQSSDADRAMKFSQAALNLAHTIEKLKVALPPPTAVPRKK
tara:strand:- start:6835 stop:7065 length:231 start_codon:yes stop_codon:yes gene_type:complete